MSLLLTVEHLGLNELGLAHPLIVRLSVTRRRLVAVIVAQVGEALLRRILDLGREPALDGFVLLANVAVLHDGQEGGRHEVVAEPDPYIAKEEGNDIVDRRQEVIQVLYFVAVHGRPQHDHAAIQASEAVTAAKVRHAEEREA